MKLFYKIGHEHKYHNLAIITANDIYLQLKQNEMFAYSNNFYVIFNSGGGYLKMIVYHQDEEQLYREIYYNHISKRKELTHYDLHKFYYKSCIELMGAIHNFIILTKYCFEVAHQQTRIKTRINIIKGKVNANTNISRL